MNLFARARGGEARSSLRYREREREKTLAIAFLFLGGNCLRESHSLSISLLYRPSEDQVTHIPACKPAGRPTASCRRSSMRRITVSISRGSVGGGGGGGVGSVQIVRHVLMSGCDINHAAGAATSWLGGRGRDRLTKFVCVERWCGEMGWALEIIMARSASAKASSSSKTIWKHHVSKSSAKAAFSSLNS